MWKRLLPALGALLALATISGVLLAFAGDADSDGNPARQPPVRSDEGIEPDECNLVHNIDACSPEELEEGGIGPIDGPVPQPPVRSDEGIEPDECNLVHNIDACSPEERLPAHTE